MFFDTLFVHYILRNLKLFELVVDLSFLLVFEFSALKYWMAVYFFSTSR